MTAISDGTRTDSTDQVLPTAAELEQTDRTRLLHPHQSGAVTERRVMVRGRDCTLWDARGDALLDLSGGGNWLCQVGHGRQEIVDAMAAQAGELAYFGSFFLTSTPVAVRLADRLASLAPDGLERVFFTCGGSESVESAIKMARLYHHHNGKPDKTWIISRHFAYHGATYGSGTATGFPPMQDGVGPNLPHVEKVSPAALYRAEHLYDGQDPTDWLLNELEETIRRIGPENIAAMIGEPVMGGAGVLAPPADYWPRVRALLTQHDILLIADEVVTAFGRTGAVFDSPARGMDADLITTAKGLTSGYAPLGAVIVREDIAETVAGEDAYFFHGHTYSAHPVACAAAEANLDIIEREGLLARAQEIAGWFRTHLAPLAELEHVGDIRVEGATAAIELVVSKETTEPIMGGEVTTVLRNEKHILVRDYGPAIVFSPPLVIEEAEVARACRSVSEVVARLRPDGTVAPA